MRWLRGACESQVSLVAQQRQWLLDNTESLTERRESRNCANCEAAEGTGTEHWQRLIDVPMHERI